MTRISISVTETITHEIVYDRPEDEINQLIDDLGSDPTGTVSSMIGPRTWRDSDFDIEHYIVTEHDEEADQ